VKKGIGLGDDLNRRVADLFNPLFELVKISDFCFDFNIAGHKFYPSVLVEVKRNAFTPTAIFL
jgi:hypothetical protein